MVTLGLVLVIIAVLLSFTGLALVVIGKKQNTAQISTEAPVASPAIVRAVEEPKPPRILSDGRIVVGVTPEYIFNLYKTNTTTKADKLVEQYKNNWIEISGRFGDVNSPASDPAANYTDTMLMTFAYHPEWG